MAFWFQCPICKSKRLATDGIIGRRVRCADCSNFVDVGIPPKGSHVDDSEMQRLVDEMITEDALADPVQFKATGIPQTESLQTAGDDSDGADDLLPDDLLSDDIVEDAEPIELIESESVSDSKTFALTSPTVDIIELQESERRRPPAQTGRDARSKLESGGRAKKEKSKAPKPEPNPDGSDFVEPPVFKRKGAREEAEMDMTPMVDVTFLLLIFFMVTASFTMQKSMNRPTETTDDPSTQPIESEEDNPDMVQVDIDEFNSYFVILPEEDPIEAPSEQDLRIALRNAKQGGATGISPTKLLIRAHAESFHEKVVTAMDVGTDLDYQLQVQIIDGDM